MDMENQNNAPADNELFDLGKPQEAPKKKKKTGLIIAIIAVVVAIAVAACLLLRPAAGGSGEGAGKVEDFTKMSAHDSIVRQEKDALYAAADTLAATFGNLSAGNTANIGGAELDMHLLLGDDLLTLLETYLAASGANMELDWLTDIGLSYALNANDDAMQILLELALGKKTVAGMDIIMDESDAYIGTPGLNEYYMTQDLETMMGGEVTGSMGFSTIMQQTTGLQQAFIDAMPSEEAMQKSFRSYADLALTLLANPTEATEELTAAGTTLTYSTVTYKVTEEQMIDLVIAMLKQVKDDATLKEIIDAYVGYLNELAVFSGTEAALDADDFLTALDEGIAEMESEKAEASAENYIEVTCYLDSSNALSGHKILYSAEGEEPVVPIRWITIADGDKEKLEITITADDESFTITGEQSVKNDAYSGTFQIPLPDDQELTLELKDIKLSSSALSGRIQITPNKELLETITADSALPLSMLGGDLALQVDFDLSDSVSLEAHVMVDDKSLVGITYDVSATSAQTITIPSDKVLEDPNEWAGYLDFEGLVENLVDAGVPMELLEQLVTMAFAA